MNVGEAPREQTVTAHGEEDPGLAVHDHQDDAGDRDQGTEGEYGPGPGDPGTLVESGGQRCVLPVKVLIGATPMAATATRTYKIVEITSEPTMAIGRSRLGFFDSSEPVVTASKPM